MGFSDSLGFKSLLLGSNAELRDSFWYDYRDFVSLSALVEVSSLVGISDGVYA